MQSTNCNDHRYTFEKMLVLRGDCLESDPEWSQRLLERLPNWRPNPLSRTLVIQDSPTIYNLQIWNNLASCTALTGAGTVEHMDILVRYLRHTIKEAVKDLRLIKETGFKLFVYVPREISLSPEFSRVGSQELTILGERAPPGTSEWRYCFSFESTPWTQFGSSQPTGAQPFGSSQPTGAQPFGPSQPTATQLFGPSQPTGTQLFGQPFGQQNKPFSQPLGSVNAWTPRK